MFNQLSESTLHCQLILVYANKSIKLKNIQKKEQIHGKVLKHVKIINFLFCYSNLNKI